MNRRILVVGTVAVALVLVHRSFAEIVNVDFKASGAEPTHVGADGVLSTTGDVWNGVVFDTSVSDLVDESGNTTPVDVTLLSPFLAGTDGVPATNLQDSGIRGANGFQILDLLPNQRYELAVYVGMNSGFLLTDSNGTTPFFNGLGNTPTYTLPGTLNEDYYLIPDVVPFDTGGGVYGLQVNGIDGLVMGFQLELVPEPATLTVFALGSLVMTRRRS